MAAKKKAKGPSKNPLTGGAPNTFTASDQALDAPKNPRKTAPTLSITRKENSRRAAFEEGGGGAPEIGYNKPEGMSHHDFYWLMGQHKDKGAAVPDINTPHASDPYAITNRRAEDQSGEEYQRGKEILKKHGSSTEKLKSDIGNSMDRSVASSVKAGAPRPAGQLFYGGKDEKGELSQPVHFLHEAAKRVAASKHFPSTGDAAADYHLAHAMMTVASSKTSPRTPFLSNDGTHSPNTMAAEATVHAALEGREAPLGTKVGAQLRARGADVPNIGVPTFPANLKSATHAVAQMAVGARTGDLQHESLARMFDPTEAPKTTDYQAAHQAPEGPDAKTVVDVHEGGNAFPHLGFAASHKYEAVGHDGQTLRRGGEVTDDGEVLSKPKNRVLLEIHPDEFGPHGELPARAKAALPADASHWQRATKQDPSDPDKRLPEWGKSRSEAVVAEGKNIISGMVDHAARQVHAERGMSPSVNNAQFVHRGQASRWTQRQIDRPDLTQSIESEYGLPKPHEHMWSGAAELHDNAGTSLHELTGISDYEVEEGHPWAGVSAPPVTHSHAPDERTPDEVTGTNMAARYKANPTPKPGPDMAVRAKWLAAGGKPK